MPTLPVPRPSADVIGKLVEFIGQAPVVAHNVAFDLPFITRNLPPRSSWEPSAVFDTLELAYQLYPDAGSYKLADLVRFVFGRDHGAAHRAMPDAEATAELFINLTDGLADRLQAVRNDIADEVRRAREQLQSQRAGRALRGDPPPPRHRLRADGRPHQGDRPRAGPVARTSGSTAATRPPSGRSAWRSASCRAPTDPGIFTRGQTQALSIATLGPSSDEQRMDTISPETEKRYLHHYNMPPYSVGEAKLMRGPGRREIGHGALAERALLPVLPSVEEFPYIIRVVSRGGEQQRLDQHGVAPAAARWR